MVDFQKTFLKGKEQQKGTIKRIIKFFFTKGSSLHQKLILFCTTEGRPCVKDQVEVRDFWLCLIFSNLRVLVGDFQKKGTGEVRLRSPRVESMKIKYNCFPSRLYVKLVTRCPPLLHMMFMKVKLLIERKIGDRPCFILTYAFINTKRWQFVGQ